MKLMLVVAVASAVSAGLTGWTANGWRLNSKIDNLVAQHSMALAQANQKALAEYQAMERKKQNAIDQANKTAQANAAIAAAVRVERDRLRDQITTNATGLSTATLASTRAYAAALTTVFGECTERLEAVAKDADGHALDSKTFINAWPK